MHWPAHKAYCIEKRRRMGEDMAETSVQRVKKKGGFGNFGEGNLEDFYGEPLSSERQQEDSNEQFRKRVKSQQIGSASRPHFFGGNEMNGLTFGQEENPEIREIRNRNNSYSIG